jgi:sulfite exporter TauE/SafE
MQFWTGLMLGFVGSLHCAGMCGPLVLALPVVGKTRSSFLISRVVYNLGRIGTYGMLGLGFGLVGQTFAFAGLQRWVSLAAGALIILSLFASGRANWGTPAFKTVGWLKTSLAKLFQQRSYSSLFALGSLNGLLPCGLVYVACAAASASSSALEGGVYMMAFGVGTLPMMLGISLAGKKLQSVARLNPQRLIPVSLALVGALLILRGLALGIPYLSPVVDGNAITCPHCH